MMSWTWHWWLFVISLIICTLLVMFARGYMNASNVAQHGSRADYRTDPGAAILGSIFAGAVYAVVLTAVGGLIFEAKIQTETFYLPANLPRRRPTTNSTMGRRSATPDQTAAADQARIVRDAGRGGQEYGLMVGCSTNRYTSY
jgi:hypothetical protein